MGTSKSVLPMGPDLELQLVLWELVLVGGYDIRQCGWDYEHLDVREQARWSQGGHHHW